MLVSVLTCTYNPRREILQRAVESVRQQQSEATFEYLLVDNASTEPISEDLLEMNNGRVLREPRIGKIHALLRGLDECRGDLVVIVDDDNLLAPDYLDKALQIYREMPAIGVWGGEIIPEYEIPPPSWALPHLHQLTIRSLDRDLWSNLYTGPVPAGAGMCLRRSVAERFIDNLKSNPKRSELTRKGDSDHGGDDWEMALSACDIGLGMGLFQRLKLTHVIPAKRLQLEYLLRLTEAGAFSYQAFVRQRGLSEQQVYIPSKFDDIRRWWRYRRLSKIERMFREAYERGIRRGSAH